MESEQKLRILQLSNKSPFPPNEGGPMAMFSVIDGWISQGFEVDVLTMATPKFKPVTDTIPTEWNDKLRFKAVYVDSRIRPIGVLFNLFSPQSYLASRFRSTSFAYELRNLLQQSSYDLIQLESPMLACYLPLIRSLSNARVVLRAHNIEHRIWERVAHNQQGMLKRVYLKMQLKRLSKLELSVWNKVDGIVAITENDARDIRIRTTKPVEGIPFGIRPGHKRYTPSHEKSICFIGSLDWMPNLEGLQWFTDQVWPLIRQAEPEVVFYVAGRNFPPHLKTLDSQGIIGLGEVPDSLDFICSHGVLVVPLLSGSGIRIKIIEAMSAACPIVSTAIGCEGIKAEHEKELLIANSAADFARAVVRILNDAELRYKISTQARQLVLNEYTVEECMRQFLRFYHRLGIKTTAQ